MAGNADVDAIYLRVSGDEQTKQETVKTQEHVIRETFGPEGREVYAVYADDPYTGTVIDRPALNRLLTDARAGKFNRVLIYDPDRLWRGGPGGRPMLEFMLQQAGCIVRYARRERDDSDTGQMMALMDDVLSSMERNKIASRFADGRANKRARGALFRGPRPYGWRYVKPPVGRKDGHIEPVEAETPIVREIFTLVLSGTSTKDVAAILNGRGVPNVRGNLWSAKNVRDMVHNPIHTGRPATRRYTTVEPVKARSEYRRRVRSSQRELPREQWERVDIGHAVVSEEEYEQAAACLLTAQTRAKRNSKSIFPLSGLLRCGQEHDHLPGKVCGRLLHGYTTRGGNRYYSCSRRASSDRLMDRRCPGRAVARVVESQLMLWMNDALCQPEVLLTTLQLRAEQRQAEQDRVQAELAAAHAAHEEIQAKLTALMLRSLEPGADKTTIGQAEVHLHQQRTAAEGRIDLCQRQLAQAALTATQMEDFKQYCESNRQVGTSVGLSEADGALTIKQHFFRKWFDAVWLLPDGSLGIKGILPSLTPEQSGTIAAQSLQALSALRFSAPNQGSEFPVHALAGGQPESRDAVGTL
jgi:site-specific DNA recombinase